MTLDSSAPPNRPSPRARGPRHARDDAGPSTAHPRHHTRAAPPCPRGLAAEAGPSRQARRGRLRPQPGRPTAPRGPGGAGHHRAKSSGSAHPTVSRSRRGRVPPWRGSAVARAFGLAAAPGPPRPWQSVVGEHTTWGQGHTVVLIRADDDIARRGKLLFSFRLVGVQIAAMTDCDFLTWALSTGAQLVCLSVTAFIRGAEVSGRLNRARSRGWLR